MVQNVIKILISIPDTCNSVSRAQEQKLGSHTIIQIALSNGPAKKQAEKQ